ncbi:MAG: HNH endonuclease, partial [Gillisia sp.]
EIVTTSSKSIKSFKSLRDSIAFAEIDKDLFFLLQDPINQMWFEQLILEKYFPDFKTVYQRPAINYEEERIENEILNEPKEAYLNHMQNLKEILQEGAFEEEIFVRGSLFKKTIPKVYDYTCSITGMKVESTHNVQMIDACHIYPFSISNDDTVTNGITLSPTLHRAFDRGLITINSNFVVRVSPTITKEESNFTISQFDGRNIILPENEKFYPSQESLIWHNKEVFLL